MMTDDQAERMLALLSTMDARLSRIERLLGGRGGAMSVEPPSSRPVRVEVYAAEKDGLACVRCGRSKGSHNQKGECVPKEFWTTIVGQRYVTRMKPDLVRR